MTDADLNEAARLWKTKLYDTLAIARLLRVPEAEVYNNLWRIRERAKVIAA